MAKEKDAYKDERFDFILYVNDFIICKRNFRILDYIEDSMHSVEFKEEIDNLVRLVDEDFKSKSRIWVWNYFNPMEPEANEELNSPLLKPYECTFKIEIKDNKKLVYSRIWDGYGYPKLLRERVDITNRLVKLMTKEGKVLSFEKEAFFNNPETKMNFELSVIKSMLADRIDFASFITRRICELCSYHDDGFKRLSDYTTDETYGGKTYRLNINSYNKSLERRWGKMAQAEAEARESANTVM